MKNKFNKTIQKFILNRQDRMAIDLFRDRTFFQENYFKAYLNKWKTSPCVFVLSTGRTGTMTLSSLLNLSKNIFSLHEPSPVLLTAGYEAYFKEHEEEKWISVVNAARDELIAYANHQNCIYVETNNRLTFLSKAIAEAYPSSKFIHLHRHPYDVIVSGVKRNWYCGDVLDYARITPKVNDPMAEKWNKISQEMKIAWFWKTVNNHSVQFTKSLSSSRIFDLRAEDLFLTESKKISELFNFIGVSMPTSKSIQKILSLKMNAQKNGTAVSSIEWPSNLKKEINKILIPTAEILNYPLSD